MKIMNKRIAGMSIMEVMMALAIMLMLLPFVYKQVTKQTYDAQNVVIANTINDVANVSENYIKVNEKGWKGDYEEMLDGYYLLTKMQDYGLKLPIPLYPNYFYNIYLMVSKKEKEISTDKIETFNQVQAYLIYELTLEMDDVRAWKIVSSIGEKAGFLNEGLLEGFQGSWQISGFESPAKRAIVIRLSYLNPFKEKKKHLYANVIGGYVSEDQPVDTSFNTMEADLYLGTYENKFNIDGVRTAYSSILKFDTMYVSNLAFDENISGLQFSAKNAKFDNGLRVGNLTLNKFETEKNIYGDINDINVKELKVEQISVGNFILERGLSIGSYIHSFSLELDNDMYVYSNPLNYLYSCNFRISKSLYFNAQMYIQRLNIVSALDQENKCTVQRDANGNVVFLDEAGNPIDVTSQEYLDNPVDLYAVCTEPADSSDLAGQGAEKFAKFTYLPSNPITGHSSPLIVDKPFVDGKEVLNLKTDNLYLKDVDVNTMLNNLLN